jgi:osmotically-inducible protein OsmY
MRGTARQRLAIGAAVLAAAGAAGCSTARAWNARSTGVPTVAPARAEALKSSLETDTRLPRGASVAVDPQTGIVRLSGSVANAEERVNAGRLVCSVEGVTVVYNELEIRRAAR